MSPNMKKARLPAIALMFLGLTNTLYGQSDAIDPEHLQLLEDYCSECHNFDDFAGGLAFDLLDTNDLLSDAETWEKVLLKLKAGMMPPLGKERPGKMKCRHLSLIWLMPLIVPGVIVPIPVHHCYIA